jgi:hypothetical protein
VTPPTFRRNVGLLPLSSQRLYISPKRRSTAFIFTEAVCFSETSVYCLYLHRGCMFLRNVALLPLSSQRLYVSPKRRSTAFIFTEAYVSPKRRCLPTSTHGVIAQKTAIYRRSNCWYLFFFFWASSIVLCIFQNHYVPSDGSSPIRR